MAILVQITGMPSTGKSRGVRELDPKTTFYIDADKKGLPWAGWRKDYSTEAKNYIRTSDLDTIRQVLSGINTKAPHIKTVVIDTINGILTDKVMLDMKKASFDAWRDFSIDAYTLYDEIRDQLRDDLIVVITAHVEEYTINGPGGSKTSRFRTLFPGKQLTKLNMYGKLNYNLYTQVETVSPGVNEYYFITQTDGTTEARSSEGVLPYKMPNSLLEVVTKIREAELN